KTRNVLIAAMILVLSIGIAYSSAGAFVFTVGDVAIHMSGLAVGALVGIFMNAVLPGKDYNFDEETPSETGVDFSVRNKEK
ncbi:MAG: uracil-xanthine permease, partial [Acetatifactor sp.]|nr:uracil-xanthine permease [Acetatifactor sp.]